MSEDNSPGFNLQLEFSQLSKEEVCGCQGNTKLPRTRLVSKGVDMQSQASISLVETVVENKNHFAQYPSLGYVEERERRQIVQAY